MKIFFFPLLWRNADSFLSWLDVHCLDYVQRYATKEAADAADGKSGGAAEDEQDEDAEMSDIGSFSDPDDE